MVKESRHSIRVDVLVVNAMRQVDEVEDSLSGLTNDVLKEICDMRNAVKKGTKSELLTRLRELAPAVTSDQIKQAEATVQVSGCLFCFVLFCFCG